MNGETNIKRIEQQRKGRHMNKERINELLIGVIVGSLLAGFMFGTMFGYYILAHK